MKNYLFSFVLAACFAAAPVRAAEMMAPDALAKSVTDDVLAVVRADKDIQSGNRKKVLDLVEAKVLPHFNFTRMAQLAMGKNWRQASAGQQKALADEFRILLVHTYTAAFTQYRNQTIEYRPLRLAPDDADVVVKSLIKQPGGQPVAVDYGMEKTDRGWKVYNVKIEGVSLVENYRNTFNAEVQRNGIDGLIKSLAEKNRTLAQASQK
ncbi:MAG TPA: ABC transporter substrate-binding protein [Burkholderiales bacterium]|nr:ABC transporter substrate-binding protein [Burkholderiales bacterium]